MHPGNDACQYGEIKPRNPPCIFRRRVGFAPRFKFAGKVEGGMVDSRMKSRYAENNQDRLS
jgi:hypothetical protein